MACTFQLETGVPLSVRTPVGPVTGVPLSSTPDSLETVRAMSGQLAALLAPLQAVFAVVEVVVLATDVLASIPAAIGSLSPGKITSSLGKLTGRLGSIVQLLPQFSAIRLARDVVGLAEANLRAVRAALVDLQAQEQRRDTAAAAAAVLTAQGETAAAARLVEVAGCVDALLADQRTALQAGNTGIDAVIGVVNTLIKLIPPGSLPTIPTLGSIPADLGDAIALIDAEIDALAFVRQALGPV